MEEKNLDLGDEEDFEFVDDGGSNPDDNEFDLIVGNLQDIVLEERFVNLMNDFLNQYCMIFEDEEENKIEYMEIFKKYQSKIEKYIEEELMKRIKGFEMIRFLDLLKDRNDRIDDQILDTLLSFSEFLTFKELMLAHKKVLNEREIIKKQKSTAKKNVKSNVKKDQNIFKMSNNKEFEELKNFQKEMNNKNLKKKEKDEIEEEKIDEKKNSEILEGTFFQIKPLETPKKILNKKKNNL